MKINIITLGCSKNTADSEHLAGHLRKAGVDIYFDRERNDCDVIIVNTCGFIGDATPFLIGKCNDFSHGFSLSQPNARKKTGKRALFCKKVLPIL